MQAPIIDPGRTPFGGVVSAVHKSALKPGELAECNGLRWDRDIPYVRGGTKKILNLPVTGATIVNRWEGQLNGVWYVVGAFLVATHVEIWYSLIGDADDWTRLSQVGWYSGGTTGDTRFSDDSTRVDFAAFPTPQGSLAGTTISSRDVLFITNGVDTPLIWDPGAAANPSIALTLTGATNATPIRVTTSTNHRLNDGDTVVITGVIGNLAANGSFYIDKQADSTFDLYEDALLTVPVAGTGAWSSGGTISGSHTLMAHKVIEVPTNADKFRQIAGFDNFWQVAGPSGKTFTNSTAARFKFADSATAPYDAGADLCILWMATTAAVAADRAAIRFGTQLNIQNGLLMWVEDTTSAVSARSMVQSVKLRLGVENVADGSVSTWVTIYDPTDADASKRSPLEFAVDYDPNNGKPRYCFLFPTDHMSQTAGYHLEATYQGQAPAANINVIILALAAGGGFPGASVWGAGYGDAESHAESATYMASATEAMPLSSIGGPTRFSATVVPKVPISTAIQYDYHLVAANYSADIEGGLNGKANRLHVYLRLADETTAYYAFSESLYDAVSFGAGPIAGSRGWAVGAATATIDVATSDWSETYSLTAQERDFFRPALDGQETAIPPCVTCCFANGRLFVGGVIDDAGELRRSDLYFSRQNRPFTMCSITLDSRSGTRLQFGTEQLQRIWASAAGSIGSSRVFVWTDECFYALGPIGALTGSEFDTENLEIARRIMRRGTRSPDSVAENSGALFWLDQFCDYWRYDGGVPRNLSRKTIGDKPHAIPAGRLPYVGGQFLGERYYSPYTLEGGTRNAAIAVWNDVLGVWESGGEPPPVNAERIGLFYDSTANGNGQRLMIWSEVGAAYEYDLADYGDLSADALIPVQITSAELSRSEAEASCAINTVTMDVTPQVADVQVDRYTRGPDSQQRTSIDLTDGWADDDGQEADVITAPDDGGDFVGRGAWVDLNVSLATGSQVFRVVSDVEGELMSVGSGAG